MSAMKMGLTTLESIMDMGQRMADGTVFPRSPLAVSIEHPLATNHLA